MKARKKFVNLGCAVALIGFMINTIYTMVLQQSSLLTAIASCLLITGGWAMVWLVAWLLWKKRVAR